MTISCLLMHLTWTILRGHQMPGNGVPSVSPRNQERRGLGISSSASRSHAHVPLKQITLKKDIQKGSVILPMIKNIGLPV